MFKDAPQEFIYDHKSRYRPTNYGGGWMRDVTMRTGLIKSLNVVTVDVAMQTDSRESPTLLRNSACRVRIPIRHWPWNDGSLPCRWPAYATFANGGKYSAERRRPDREPQENQHQPASAYVITDMLEGVIDHGNRAAAWGQVRNTVAGKRALRAMACRRLHAESACAVWIGFDDNKQLGLTGRGRRCRSD
jgi:penicillin-binding protein 1B